MRHWKPIIAVACAAALLAVLAGCGSDPVAPQDQTNLDAATAEQWSTQVLGTITEMAATVPAVSQGDFSQVAAGAKSATEPTWDEYQQAWVMAFTQSFSEGDPPTSTGEMSVSVWIQFRNAEGPLVGPLGATEMEYRATSGMVLDSTENGASHLEFDYATTMKVTYLETGYGVDGTGEASISATQTTAQGSQSVAFALGYGMDLALPFAGCPAGSAWVTAGQYRTDAVYDGEGKVDWTVNGPNYQSSGSDTVPCGLPQ